MDFVKKNLGLVIYCGVCFVLIVAIGMGIKRAAGAAGESGKNVRSQADFFDDLSRKKFSLSKTNRDIARANQALVERKFGELREWLANTYRLPRSRNLSSVECVRTLQREIRRMRNDLQEKGVIVNEQKCKYLSFDRRAAARGFLPGVNEVPAILRQLSVVSEIVRLVGASGVRGLENMVRLKDLEVIKEDHYTITPVRVSVLGSLPQIQDFINRLHTDSAYLFFLRQLSLTATEDPAAGGMLAGFGAPAGGGRARPGGGMEMPVDDPGIPGGAMPGAGFVPGAAARGGERGENAFAEMDPRDVRRSDLRVFQSRALLVADIRIDLIEFLAPKQEAK